jgi:hypothetical protein
VVVDRDEDPVVGAAARDIDEEAGIGLLVDEAVVGGILAEAVVKDARGAVVVVEARVEEAVARSIPCAAAARAGDDILESAPLSVSRTRSV